MTMKTFHGLRAVLVAVSAVLGGTEAVIAQDQSAPSTPLQYIRCTAFDLVETPGRPPQDKNCPTTALFRDPREPRLPTRVCKEGTPEEERACSDAFLAETEARLNAVYREARTKLQSTGTQRERQLLLAQRQWIRFRTAHCDEQIYAYAQTKSPQRDSFLYRACLDQEAVRRIYYLETQVLGRPASVW